MMRASKEKAAECIDHLLKLGHIIKMETYSNDTSPAASEYRAEHLQRVRLVIDFVEAACHKLPSEAEYYREQAEHEMEQARRRLRKQRIKEAAQVLKSKLKKSAKLLVDLPHPGPLERAVDRALDDVSEVSGSLQ